MQTNVPIQWATAEDFPFAETPWPVAPLELFVMPFSSEQIHDLLINAKSEQKQCVIECALASTFHPDTRCTADYEKCGDGLERFVVRVCLPADVAERAEEVADLLLGCGVGDDEFGNDIDLVRVSIVAVVIKSRSDFD